MIFFCVRIADFFEDIYVEETVDVDQEVLLRLLDSFYWNILYLSVLILTVCEMQTLLKQMLKGLMMSLLSLYLILLQSILVKIFLSVAYIFL